MDKSNIITEQKNNSTKTTKEPGKIWAWLNIGVTVLLFAAGIWYLISRVSLAEMGKALASANLFFILLSLATMMLALLLKAWRWQLMFPARPQNATLLTFFWSLLLGAYINVLVPFLRLGEIARIVALERLTAISKAQSLATLVLEKTLDMIMIGLTITVLLTAVVLPDYLSGSTTTLLVSLAALLVLWGFYLIAMQTNFIINVLSAIFNRLPPAIGQRLTRWTISGFAGLAALRNKRLAWKIISISLLIAIVAVSTPLLLLYAFHLPLGWVEAAIIHIAVTIALVPPTTPGKIGIFDGVVAFLLLQFGVKNEAVIASYTIIFHLIIILPMIVLGSIAASRSNISLRRKIA